jgi:hypothetical protein
MKEAAPDQPMHVPREPKVRAGALVVMAAVRGAEPDTTPPGGCHQLTAVSSHRCCDRPGVLSGARAGLLAFAATDKHRLAALEAAIANVIYADAFVGVIATSRLWTCVGFRCQTVTVDTGPRIWPPIAQV